MKRFKLHKIMFGKKKKKFQLKTWQGYLLICFTIIASASLWSSFWYVNGIYEKAIEAEPVAAATIRWDGGGTNALCGAGHANDFTCRWNWEGDAIPTAADIAVFDGALSNKNANASITFGSEYAGIIIENDYTGTISQTGNIYLGSSGFTQDGGTFLGFSGAGRDIEIDGDLILNAGTFRSTANFNMIGLNQGLILNGDLYVANGANFQHNNGMIIFNSSSTIDIGNDYIEFEHFVVSNSIGSTVSIDSSDTVVVLGRMYLDDGYLAANGRLEMRGDIMSDRVGGSFDGLSGTLVFNSPFATNVSFSPGSRSSIDAEIIIEDGNCVSFGNLIFDAGNDITINGGCLSLQFPITMNGTLTNNANLDIQGEAADYIIPNYIEADPDSHVSYTFDPGTPCDINLLTDTYTNLNINTDDCELLDDLIVTRNFEITADNVDVSASNYNVTVGGDWYNTGSFIPRTGTVNFNNAANSNLITGDTNFYNLTCTTPGKDLEFTAGSTQNVAGNFTIAGSAGNPVTLHSDTDGVDWNLNVTGNTNVSSVDVKDSNASLGNVVRATRSTNSGNNSNWVFGTASDSDVVMPVTAAALSINQDNVCASDKILSLEIQALNAAEILVSESPYFVANAWQPFMARESTTDEIPVMEISWPLQDESYGTKTIYLQLRSSTQNLSNIFSDTIEYSSAADCPAVGGGAGEETETVVIKDINELKSGDYIKGETLEEIYYVDTDTQNGGLARHSTLDLISFYTYGKSISVIKKVADTALRLLTFGQVRVHNPGVVLIQFETRPEIYVIKENAQNPYKPLLLEITDQSIPKAALGQNWQDYIVKLNVAFYERFQIDGIVTSQSQIDASKMKTLKELQSMIEVGK